MKHLRRMALCLLVALALSVTAASAASAALPEFVGAIPQPFTSKLKAATLETVGKTMISCTAGTNVGELTGAKTLTVTIKLTGCSTKAVPCTSSGAAVGEIVTTTLTGVLGYIKAAKKIVGLDLSAPTGGPITTFSCSAELKFVVVGSVIGKVTPVNAVVTPPAHFTVKFAQKEGKQKPKKFEGGPIDVPTISLNGGPFEESGLKLTDELSFAAPLEVKA